MDNSIFRRIDYPEDSIHWKPKVFVGGLFTKIELSLSIVSFGNNKIIFVL